MTATERMVEGIRRRVDLWMEHPNCHSASITIQRRKLSGGQRYFAGSGKGFQTLHEALLSLTKDMALVEPIDHMEIALSECRTKCAGLKMLLETKDKTAEKIIADLAKVPELVAEHWGQGELVRRAKGLVSGARG
jgi:hypothetical protein